jgi:hypothetical protein
MNPGIVTNATTPKIPPIKPQTIGINFSIVLLLIAFQPAPIK